MEQYKPKETDFIGIIKKQLRNFLDNSDTLTDDQKAKLKDDLGWNHFDARFDGSQFLEDAIGYSVHEWKEQNLKLVDLWIQIAINNASNSDIPFEVADETIKRFKKQFDPELPAIK